VSAGARLAGDPGFTLVELLVTVVILGIAFTVFVGGMGTSILASDYHRRQASTETVLRDFAETLKSRNTTYVTCATTYSAPSTPPGYTASVTAVAYWNGTNAYVNPLSTCPAVDNGLQRISLRATSSAGRDAETVDIVKRKP
jgi:prepilin-type N-terminal cleavage/methylation domain-containing protein